MSTSTPAAEGLRATGAAISNETSTYDDVTDNDPADEGFAYLSTIYKSGNKPTKDDYDYADKVRTGKNRKSLFSNVIKNAAFWIYMIFNFVLTIVNLFVT